jgi:MFS family permease
MTAVLAQASPAERRLSQVDFVLISIYWIAIGYLWQSLGVLILMGIVGIQSFALYYFSDVFFHGDSKRTVTATYTLLGLVVVLAFLVSWPAARLSDRVGRRPLVSAVVFKVRRR